MKPTITIICITYNQEKYIKKTLDGFTMQKTSYPLEILIHDDASTDNTSSILKKYASNDPRVKLIIEKNNQFQKGNLKFIDHMFKNARGKYIALCEGDDYWTNPNKLQEQVNFLEARPDYALCFHTVKVIFEDKKTKSYLFPGDSDSSKFTTIELINRNFIQTNSVMYRSQSYKNLNSNVLPNDWYLHLYHARFGKIGFINKPMAIYRRHTSGVWWEGVSQKQAFWNKYWLSHIVFFTKVLELFKNDKDAIRATYTSIGRVFTDALLYSDKKNKIVEKIVDDYPEFSKIILKAQAELVDEDKNTIERLVEKNHNLDRLNHQNIYTIEKLQLDYDGAINSLSWKVTKPLRAVKKVVKKKR